MTNKKYFGTGLGKNHYFCSTNYKYVSQYLLVNENANWFLKKTLSIYTFLCINIISWLVAKLSSQAVYNKFVCLLQSAQASESEIVDVTGIQELIQDTSHEYNIFSDKFENGQSREVFAYVNPEYELHAVDRETVQDTEENLEDVKSKVQEENVGHRRRKVCQSPFEIQIEMTEQDFTKTDSTKYLKRQTTRVCPSPFEIQDEMEDTVSNEDIAGLQELNRSATYEFELPRDSCENGQIKDINPKYEMYSFKQETKKCEENLEQCGNNACEPPVENRNEIGVQDLTRSDNTCSEVLHQMTRVCPSPFEIPE